MATAIDSCHKSIDTWLRSIPCMVYGASSQMLSPPISGALKRKYLDDMPSLSPSENSSSASSRPPNPRKQLLQLQKAIPPVKFYYPGSAVVQPEQVATLSMLLAKDIEQKVIPRSLEVQFVLSM
jgi:hypothetical protein